MQANQVQLKLKYAVEKIWRECKVNAMQSRCQKELLCLFETTLTLNNIADQVQNSASVGIKENLKQVRGQANSNLVQNRAHMCS